MTRKFQIFGEKKLKISCSSRIDCHFSKIVYLVILVWSRENEMFMNLDWSRVCFEKYHCTLRKEFCPIVNDYNDFQLFLFSSVCTKIVTETMFESSRITVFFVKSHSCFYKDKCVCLCGYLRFGLVWIRSVQSKWRKRPALVLGWFMLRPVWVLSPWWRSSLDLV